jgi:hypothetical protein
VLVAICLVKRRTAREHLLGLSADRLCLSRGRRLLLRRRLDHPVIELRPTRGIVDLDYSSVVHQHVQSRKLFNQLLCDSRDAGWIFDI